VPVEPPRELVDALRAEIPESPAARIRRIEPALDVERATELVTSGYDGLWEEVVAGGLEERPAFNVITNDVAPTGIPPADVQPPILVKLASARDRIPRDAYVRAMSRLSEPQVVEDALNEEAVSDADELGPIVDRILADNPGQVAAYRGGKEGLLGFFVGQVMKETQGKANPRVVNELVREKLGS
jgi:Asp-tRNA(Asn)/Glu-tRNA(Gln) amidotransferase B subunit